MSKGIIYIEYDEALNIYGKMIDASDGGFEGVLDEGGIRATLEFVQNDLYYPTFANKLTYLMYRFCSGIIQIRFLHGMFGKFIHNMLYLINSKFSTAIFLESFTDSSPHTIFKRRDDQ